MQALSGKLSVGLALVGMITSISGIAASEFKPVVIGFVLLAGSAIFALLYIGSRSIAARKGRSIDVPVAHEVEY